MYDRMEAGCFVSWEISSSKVWWGMAQAGLGFYVSHGDRELAYLS